MKGRHAIRQSNLLKTDKLPFASIDHNLDHVMFQPGPPGIPVLKVTNSRSSFGKIPKIPV